MVRGEFQFGHQDRCGGGKKAEPQNRAAGRSNRRRSKRRKLSSNEPPLSETDHLSDREQLRRLFFLRR